MNVSRLVILAMLTKGVNSLIGTCSSDDHDEHINQLSFVVKMMNYNDDNQTYNDDGDTFCQVNSGTVG